jgi:hypothetical protein
VAAAVLLLAWRLPALRVMARQRLEPRLDRDSPTGALSPAEVETLVAFGEIVVQGDAISADGRRYLADHVNERARSVPGFLALYRETAQALDRACGGSFAALDIAGRSRIVAESVLPLHETEAQRDLKLVFRPGLVAARKLAAPDLITGYYVSPAGWAVVGYEAFPGRCGELLRYTRAE